MEIIRPYLSFEIVFVFIVTITTVATSISGWLIRKAVKKSAIKPDPQPPEATPSITSTHIHAHKKRTAIIIGITAGATTLSCWYFLFTIVTTAPFVINTYPIQQGELQDYTKPITITFSSPVNFTHIKTHTNATVEGEWSFHTYVPWLPIGRKISYKPKISFLPEEKVFIYISNIEGILSFSPGAEYLLELNSPNLPTIASIDPPENSQNIPPDSNITLTLDPHDGQSTLWDISVEPSQFFTIQRNYRDKLVLDFAKPLQQGTTYRVKIFQAASVFDTTSQTIISATKDELVRNFNFSTVKPPLISSFSPEGEDILPTVPIKITFDEEMDPNTVQEQIEINPPSDLHYSWNSNNTELNIAGNNPWSNDTEYTVTFPAGLANRAGGKLETDVTYRFKTVGTIAITKSNPRNADNNIPVDNPLRITFNQPVDQKNAEAHIRLKPEVPLSYSWEENTVTIQPQTILAYSTPYSLEILQGITGPFGLPSTETVTYSFTTAPEELKLLVPYFRQQESFTCNIAATRMVLAYRGISLEEAQIKAGVGVGGTRGSGNPHNGYVADYGTYWEPIIGFVSKYKRNHFYENGTIADLVKEIQNGNPVLIWSQNGWSDPHELTWTTPDGQKIYAINGMHSYVVTGFRGPAGNPTHILVNDPWRGVSVLTVQEFNRRWKYFQKALVVEE